ncbi:MAG TPA: hypothetical protein VMT61_13080 [Candidatus Binataceae bacterium]|nr:hypothetical protein [Candidatus Binataceae bacterium]
MIYRRGLLAFATVALLATATAIPARAVDFGQLLGHGDNDPTLETFKLIHVSDLKNLMKDGKGEVYIFDANNASTRAQFGEIPGAVLLTSYDKYDLAVLPPDKHARLVFYCANWL